MHGFLAGKNNISEIIGKKMVEKNLLIEIVPLAFRARGIIPLSFWAAEQQRTRRRDGHVAYV